MPKPLHFLSKIPNSPLGSFTLIDSGTLLYASRCQSPVPLGEWKFHEDKVNPPSRAYLKLWEFFTRFKVYTKKHETCIDLGASFGGWSFVLSGLAKHVIAYDRSPLAEQVMALGNISFKEKDAFKVYLADHPEANWIFSDIICFPEKLYQFVESLLKQFPNKNYVFTIKFLGNNHGDIVSRFLALPGRIVHLS